MEVTTARQLNRREWGQGTKVALLIHGAMGESRCFWEVGPEIVAAGYRVIAVDLPGHGYSARCTSGGLKAFASRLIESVPSAPEFALGHSLGAMVLATALPVLQPERAVYVDFGFDWPPKDGDCPDSAALHAMFEADRRSRTVANLQRSRPWWDVRACEVEAEAARLLDVPTLVSLNMHEYAERRPVVPSGDDIPSLLVHADPSNFVTPPQIRTLRDRGLTVRGVPGAGHSVWYGFCEPFMRALDGWI